MSDSDFYLSSIFCRHPMSNSVRPLTEWSVLVVEFMEVTLVIEATEATEATRATDTATEFQSRAVSRFRCRSQ